MPAALQDKARVIQEVEPIVELLADVKRELETLPRSAVATRQLGVIICKLVAWRETYEPRVGNTEQNDDINEVPQRDEIDRVLKAYRRNGYFGLTDREKYVLEFFDRHYSKAA